MDMTDKTLQVYLHLKNNEGWYRKIDIADKFHLSIEDAHYVFEKLNKVWPEGKLVDWVEVDHIRKYWFVPVPADQGSYKCLTDKIRELNKEGKLSFEELGIRTGHGPRTLEKMLDIVQRRPKMGPFKDLEFEIEIPDYETDEPEAIQKPSPL